MLSPSRLFENLFDHRSIIPVRLRNFAQDSLSRLSAANASGDYTPLINQITTSLTAFTEEISDIDTSLGMQMGKTMSLDEVIRAFKKFMSDKEGVIADKLGGFEVPAFLEFYPQGVSEYSSATKTKMPVLVERISKAASTHQAALGEALTSQLTAFETNWTTVRTQQETVKGQLSGSRADRSVARMAVETALIIAIHTIAAKYPGDVKKCSSLFNFNLLYRAKRVKKEEILMEAG